MSFLECSICDKEFPVNTALDLHMQKVHGESEYLKVERKQKILLHNKDREGQNIRSTHMCTKTCKCTVPPEHKLRCTGCDLRFQTQVSLNKHIMSIHEACNSCKIQFGNSTEVEIHMKSVHSDETAEANYITEDINIEFGEDDDEEKLPSQYTTKSYPKDPEEPTQISHKSIQKSLLFGKAVENLGKVFKREAKITIGKTKATVKDSKGKTDTCLEAVVEVNDNKQLGCARLKIWGPKLDGKKKDCTVQMCKMEGQPTVSVKVLNEKIVKPLIDHLLVNSDTKNAVKSLTKAAENNLIKPSNIKTKLKEDKFSSDSLLKPKCNPCNEEFPNIRTMRKHKRDEHSPQRKPQSKPKQEIMPGQKRKQEHKSKKNVESPPRKLRVFEDGPKENEDNQEGPMEVDKVSLEEKVVNLQAEIDKMKTKQNEDEAEKKELMKTINRLTMKPNETNNPTTKTLEEKIEPVREEHIPILKGFKMIHKGISNGACLTFCAAVHVHDDERHGPIVKMKINHQMADNFDDFYINEIGLPFSETIGVGNKRRDVTFVTSDEVKKFFRNPLSGSMEVFSNQAELKAIANLYQTNIHIFTYGRPGCEPAWTLVCPDPDRECEAEFPKGAVQDMHLYHEFNNHYDLLVDEAKVKRLSEEVNVEVNEPEGKTNGKSSSNWSTIKTHKKVNKTIKTVQFIQGAIPETKPVKGEEFLSESQKVGEVMYRNKVNGFRRTNPMNEPVKTNKSESEKNQCDICKIIFGSNDTLQIHMIKHISSQKDDAMNTTNDETPEHTKDATGKEEGQKSKQDLTLCIICKLRCSSIKKLETHMKSHSGDETYDMSLLQEAIQTNTSLVPSLCYQCNRCKNTFKDKHDLRKHIKVKHPSFKPCKNFLTGKTCEFGSKCDYNHVIIAEGTFICWDCGKLFNEKKGLMAHRKTTHGVNTICRKFIEGNCDRSDDVCWYSHTTKETAPTRVNMRQDFPKLPQNKQTPTSTVLDQTKNSQSKQTPTSIVMDQTENQPTVTISQNINQPKGDQTHKMMMEVVKLIQIQNTAIMKMMTQLCQE